MRTSNHRRHAASLTAALRLAACAAMLAFSTSGASAAEAPSAESAATAPGLPDSALIQQLIAQHPAWRAQLAQTQSEISLAEQKRVGAHEWTPSLLYGRRTTRAEGPDPHTNQAEWEASLERGIRLPGKAQAAEVAAQRQRALAEARQQQLWRELSLQGVGLYADWLREQRQETVWQEQVRLLTQQSQAVERRQKLGDAARIDAVQMQAALKQAQLQAQAATQRRVARWLTLQSAFPGWPAASPSHGLSTGQTASSPLTSAQLQALLAQSPDARAPRLEADYAQALAQIDSKDTTADPIVGVKVAQARNSAEKMLALTVSWPIGGTYRSMAARASASQAEASAQRSEASQRLVARDLTLAWQEAQDSRQRWQLAQDAHLQLQAVATALDKGFQLGEGALSEVLQARRLANEQALVSSQAEVDALQAQWRWAIQSGALWPEGAALP